MGAIGHGPGPKPKIKGFEKLLAWIFGVIMLNGALGMVVMAIDQHFGTFWSPSTLPPLLASLGGILAWGLLIAFMWGHRLLNGWTSILASLFVIITIVTFLGIYSVSLTLTALVFGIIAVSLFRL